MQAFVMQGHGGLDRLAHAHVPAPELSAPDRVRIRLKAGALNHLDLWTLKGLPGLSLTFPHILGGDGAGVVESVGSGVTRVAPGDAVLFNPGISCYQCEWCTKGEHSLCVTYRLLGEHLPGTLAEYIVMPESNVERFPRADLTFPEAAAYSLVALTAWRMVANRGALKAGETVLVWGVGGGVSGMAVKVAKHIGATVIATSSSDAKLAAAKWWGADITLNHAKVDVAKEVRGITAKRGVDLVVENVGEATWDQTMRSLGRQGRVVTCGATTGPIVSLDIRRLFWYQQTIIGSTMGNQAEYREVVRLLGERKLRPMVDSVVGFGDAVKAFERLSSGVQMGKVVVEMP
ncbi:MAG: zinc-binding dehydrogenase [Gemmatimonadales bacterium]